jgi:hypothetical protein
LLCAQLWWILLGSSYCREWVILFGAGFVCAWVCVFVCVPSGQTHLFLLLFGLFCMWGGTLFCFSSEETNGGGGRFAKKKNWDCVRACLRVFLGVWLGAENYWWWWWCSVLDNRSFWLKFCVEKISRSFWSQMHNCVDHLLPPLAAVWFHAPWVLCFLTRFCFLVRFLLFLFSFPIWLMIIMFTILQTECTSPHMTLFFER